jgi:anti-sigma-K factor RskA
MNPRDDAELIVCEYVLGCLPWEERAGLEVLAAAEPDVLAVLMAWQRRLAPLHELIAPAMPSISLWPRIEERLGGVVQKERKRPRGFLEAIGILAQRQGTAAAMEMMDRLRRWRAIAIVAFAISFALAALLVAIALR